MIKRAVALLLLACTLVFAGSREREQNQLQRYCDTMIQRGGLHLKCAVLVVDAAGVAYPYAIGSSHYDFAARVLVVWAMSRSEYRRLRIRYFDPALAITEGGRISCREPLVDAKADQRTTVRHEIGHAIIEQPSNEDGAVAFAAITKHWR